MTIKFTYSERDFEYLSKDVRNFKIGLQMAQWLVFESWSRTPIWLSSSNIRVKSSNSIVIYCYITIEFGFSERHFHFLFKYVIKFKIGS